MLRKPEIPISRLRRTESKRQYDKKTVSDEWQRSLHRDRRSSEEILSPSLGGPRVRFCFVDGVPNPMKM